MTQVLYILPGDQIKLDCLNRFTTPKKTAPKNVLDYCVFELTHTTTARRINTAVKASDDFLNKQRLVLICDWPKAENKSTTFA